MRKIAAAALCLMLCVGLAACAGRVFSSKEENTISAETQHETVELKVVTSYGADDGNRKNYENAVAAYEASTGNRVLDDSSRASEEWRYKVFTDFETGSDPDVLFFFTNADAEPFIRAGKLVSIEEVRTMYPDYATNMKPAMIAEAADGKHYAVPSTGYWENLFVNRQVLERSGVAVPGPDYTWDQFLEDCEKIKQAGFIPIACSLSEIPHYLFEFLIMNNGSLENQLELPRLENGQLVMDETAENWIAWNDPQKRAAAVEFVSQLTSDETLSTFVKTEITALKSGAVPKDLNALEQSAADCNAALTGVVGAVQDRMSAAAKDYLFTNIRRVVTGKVTPEKAIEAALKLNG